MYDLTIKDNPNFGLASGIFVHNSKDQVDAVCGALYNASLNSEEFAYDYGEQASQILQLNGSPALGYGAEQLTLDLEEELKRVHQIMPPPPQSSQLNGGTTNYYLYYSDIIL